MSFKPRILYIVYEPGNFQSGLEIARRGRETGKYDCLIWCPYALEKHEHYHTQALSVGSTYIQETTLQGSLNDLFTPLSGWLSGKPARLPKPNQRSTFDNPEFDAAIMPLLTEGEQATILRLSDLTERRIRFCEDWLVRLGVDVIIFAEDNTERDSHAWIEAAKRRDILSVILSYGTISKAEPITAYQDSPAHAVHDPLYTLMKTHFPIWVEEGDGFAITRLPVLDGLARERSHLSGFDPWLVNSGHPDAIMLESENVKKRYIELGFKPESLHAIGHPMQDRIGRGFAQRKSLRRALLAQYGCDENTRIVLVAMPPHQPDRPSPFETYEALWRCYGNMAARVENSLVLVSPHPNIPPEDIAAMRAGGFTVEERSSAELLPLADMYVACVSSTIKWALAAGLPIIDFDCYGYDYPDYKPLKQVASCLSIEEFESAIADWNDPARLDKIQAIAEEEAPDWGKMDGEALTRLIDFFFDNMRGPI